TLLRRYEAGLPARRQLSGPVHFTPITDVQLVARVYYNRGVTRLRAKKFAQAVALTKASLRIDADNTIAHGNLLAGLNNWALDDCSQGRSERPPAGLRNCDCSIPTTARSLAMTCTCNNSGSSSSWPNTNTRPPTTCWLPPTSVAPTCDCSTWDDSPSIA